MKFPRGSNPAAVRRTTSGDHPRRRIDRIALQLLDIERARDLRSRLGLPVAIDTSGWLSDQIEISIQMRRDRTIWPLWVLVGPLATNLLLVDRTSIHGRCGHYNDVIGRLRELKRQIAALVRDDQVSNDSPLALAHADLDPLEARIVCQQSDRMSHGVLRLDTLIAEIKSLQAYEGRLSQIVTEYMRLTEAQRTRRGWLRA